MNDPLPPALPTAAQPPARPRGLGCFTKGCLLTVTVLMIFGVGLGTFGWFVYKSGQAYITEQPVPTKTFDPTDEQFQAVLAKLQPFGEALNEGHAATVELTADDLNTLIARLPQFAPLRGHTFLEITGGQLLADLNFPATDVSGPGQYFINARATFDASFASGKFTFALRRAEPRQGEAKEGLLPSMLRNPAVLQNYSQRINHDFNRRVHDVARQDPLVADILAKLRTAVIKDDRIIVTSVERPNGALPAASPVAAPSKTD